jgi:hypothetical protein
MIVARHPAAAGLPGKLAVRFPSRRVRCERYPHFVSPSRHQTDLPLLYALGPSGTKVCRLPIGRACFCPASQGLRCRCTTGPEAQTHYRVQWETKYSQRNAMVIPRLTAELGIASYLVT